MSKIATGLCLLLLVGILAPVLTRAQISSWRGHGDCCSSCQMPVASCSCAQAIPVATCAPLPRRQARFVPRPVTTYSNVVETQYQPQQYVEQVPITTYSNVTVDRGQYKMVWVPNPVVQQVPRTIMTQQTRTRMVPHQVVRQVPQMSTQMVPMQTAQNCAPVSSCSTCGGYSMMQPAGVFNGSNFAPGVPTMTGAATPAYAPGYYPTPGYAPQSFAPQSYATPGYAPPGYPTPGYPAPGHPSPRTSQLPAGEPTWESVRPQGIAPNHSHVPLPEDGSAANSPQFYQHSTERPIAPTAAAAWQARGVFR